MFGNKTKVREVKTKRPKEHSAGLGLHMAEMAFKQAEQKVEHPAIKAWRESVFGDIPSYAAFRENVKSVARWDNKGHMNLREDLQFTDNTALYTTVVANFVEQAFRPKLVMAGVIKSLPLDLRGASAIKVPTNTLPSAQTLPDNGAVTYNDTDYGSTTITPVWKYSATKVTHELLRHSMVDIIADQIGLIGSSLATAVDSDIVTALETATPSNDSNSNYAALGASTDISWAGIQAGLADGRENAPDANFTHLVTNPTTFSQIMVDSQVKAMLPFATSPAGKVGPDVIQIGDMKVLWSSQVSAKTTFLVDAPRAGYLVTGGPIETWDARISGALAFEVIAAQAFKSTIVRPGAAYRIMDNTA